MVERWPWVTGFSSSYFFVYRTKLGDKMLARIDLERGNDGLGQLHRLSPWSLVPRLLWVQRRLVHPARMELCSLSGQKVDTASPQWPNFLPLAPPLFALFWLFHMLERKSRALCMLGKCSITELSPKPINSLTVKPSPISSISWQPNL